MENVSRDGTHISTYCFKQLHSPKPCILGEPISIENPIFTWHFFNVYNE